MKKRALLILIHLVAWTGFLSMPFLFRPQRPGLPPVSFIEDFTFPLRLYNSIFLVPFFYLNYFLILPRFYQRGKYPLLVISFLISLIALFALNYYSTPDELKRMGTFGMLGPGFPVYMLFIVYVFSFALYLYKQWTRTVEEKLNTEIAFLKAQINPHFLFNTLNSIYALTLAKSDDAPAAVVKLSGLMRYTISDATREYVCLEKEISYIRNYMDLQRMRLPEKIRIRLDVTGNPAGKRIAPFLLVPFIENAFKHGVNPEEDSAIQIMLQVEGKQLNMNVNNKKVFVQMKDKGTSIGIDNTRRRLQLLYPGKHRLNIRDDEHNFNVDLNLQFQ
jgi:sensor histidine kinase YesM